MGGAPSETMKELQSLAAHLRDLSAKVDSIGQLLVIVARNQAVQAGLTSDATATLLRVIESHHDTVLSQVRRSELALPGIALEAPRVTAQDDLSLKPSSP